MANFIGVPSCYPKLVELRKSKEASFKNNKFLKPTTKLRYYQTIGALHMMMLERMVLGDGTGLGKCVSEDTYIPTSKGLIKIKDLCKEVLPTEDTFYNAPDNLSVLSLEGEKRAISVYYSGIKTGLKITTSKGYEIIGLKHHPLYGPEGLTLDYRRLDSFKVGNFICINRKGLFPNHPFKCLQSAKDAPNAINYKMPEYVDESLAELMGYYVSEGNSSRPQSFQITQFDPEIHSSIRQLIRNLFGYEQKFNNSDYDEDIKINSVYIQNFLMAQGINMVDKSAGQRIPFSILQSPKGVVRAFLRAYFEGDGCVEKKYRTISCSSKSEDLIKQIQLMLLQFGIVSRIKIKMVKVKVGRKPYWILYFAGEPIEIFKKEIGFVSKRKIIELEGICSKGKNTNKDIIPIGGALLKRSMTDIIGYLRKQPEHRGFSTKGSGWKGLVGIKYKEKLESYIYEKRALTYAGLKEFIDVVDRLNLSQHISNMECLRDIYEKNLFFDKIEKIEPHEAKFFDFHVPGTHNFTGNGFINHNTVQTVAAYSYLLEKDPTLKLLIVVPKSALYQWAEEFEKFCVGITARAILNEFDKLIGFNARKLQYSLFKENVMVIGYAPLRMEYEAVKEALGPNYMVVFDECTAFKSRKTETYFACKNVAETAKRVYGLSATIIKNDLEEVFSIYDVVVPGLFGRISKFKDTFCQMKMMRLMIGGKIRHIPKVVGYKNLVEFKQVLDPYFLIRRKEEVATELPTLISKKIILDMDSEQKELYKLALTGILYEERVKKEFYEVFDLVRTGATDEKTLKRYAELKEKYEKFSTEEGKKRGKLAAVTYCQMVSNGPALVNQPGNSSKADEFERLMKEELVNEKVILFTRFKSGIPFLEIICEKNHINYVKITGDQTDLERQQARLSFQNDPKCNLIFITTAGSASLNLQAAGVLIFYDTPWSYGDLVQTIGRAQRIGSIQEHVVIIHLVNRGTIDLRVINKVTDKKDLSDQILGDTAQGALNFVGHENAVVDDLYQDLLKDAEAL